MTTVKRLLAFVLAMVLLAAPMLANPPAASAAENPGMTVSVDSDRVIIHITGLGSGGAVTVYQVAANEYLAGDPYTGLNGTVSGTPVGTYTCGSTQEITLKRIRDDGVDNLYAKYYLVKDGTILAGPVYASQIIALRSSAPFPAQTKKGLTLVDDKTIVAAKDMGISNTVINMDLCQLIVANEDKNGNPIDHSGDSGLIPFVSNGKTYYFRSSYVTLQDWLISDYSKAGINVSLVVIGWASTVSDSYPASLLYTPKNTQTIGFNTSNALGMGYWVAAMEFMADRYSKTPEQGLVSKFIIGNEIDYTYDWYLIQPMTGADGKPQRADFDVFMEEYARTLRLADLAVKRYNSKATVCVSLTHNWAMSCYESYKAGRNSVRYNSYAPKDIFDWLTRQEKARGDFNWGLAVHPYAIGTTSSKPTVTDATGMDGQYYPITGDPDTTPWITCSNLELYQLYLSRPENRYNGQVRPVYITEANICSADESQVSEADYTVSTYEQAASLAQYYYRAANIDCIKEIACFQLNDLPKYKLGLIRADGFVKPAYDVWKYVDTNRSYEFANKYLPYLDKAASSYADIMPVVKSAFNWQAEWSDENVIRRTVEVPADNNTYRIFGADRYTTSFKAADTLKAQLGISKFRNIVVASGIDFPDALAGSYLAAVKDAPILLVRASNVGAVRNYIKANLAYNGTVYLLGGTNAVPKTMESGLEGFNVKRLGGANRYETNLLILKEAGVSGKDIIVCTGLNFADSLSASASGLPILLVKDGLYASQKEFLKYTSGDFIIVGGTGAVNGNIEKQLKTYGDVKRLAGNTRYETSVLVAKEFFEDPSTAVLAYAQNFPDGLSGGPLAYSMNAPLILTATGKQRFAVAYTAEAGIRCGSVLGGTGLISDAAVKQVFQMNANQNILVK